MAGISENRGIRNEKATVKAMIDLYCKHSHNHNPDLCPDCNDLVEYSYSKLDRCPFIDNKPACSRCTVHCYTPVMRNKIKAVMRFAGPRMLYSHPVLAVKHLIKKITSK